MMWFFADNIQQKMMSKCDKQIVNMLSFVMKIMKKSLYAFFSMFISIRRLWDSIITHKHDNMKCKKDDFLRAIKLWTDIYIWLMHEL